MNTVSTVMPTVIPTVTQALISIRAKTDSAHNLVRHCLQRIEACNPHYKAMNHISSAALEEALLLDEMAASNGFVGPLHGIPLCIKDNIDVQNMPTTLGSPVFDEAVPAANDSIVVARLKAAGAVIIGKNSMDEFAAHVSGTTAFRGPAVNPWQPEKHLSPGGSSSGTAVSVAAEFCCAGIGTDTGGSVRLPAGWCGLCGVRPSYGSIPMQGVYPRAACMDVVGVLTRSVADAALLLRVIADPPLQHSLNRLEALSPADLARLRVGLPWNFIRRESSPEVLDAFIRCHKQWEKLGIYSVNIDLPLLDSQEVADTVATLRAYEFARHVAKDVEQSPHKGQMHPIPMTDYRLGQSISETAYRRAQEQKAAYTRAVHQCLAKNALDFFLLPTAASSAPPLNSDPGVYTAGRKFNNLFSITEVPTVVIPAGPTALGLPIGAQLVGLPLHDHALLAAGMAYELVFGPFPVPL